MWGRSIPSSWLSWFLIFLVWPRCATLGQLLNRMQCGELYKKNWSLESSQLKRKGYYIFVLDWNGANTKLSCVDIFWNSLPSQQELKVPKYPIATFLKKKHFKSSLSFPRSFELKSIQTLSLLAKLKLYRPIFFTLSKSKPCPLGVDPGEGGFRGLKMLPRIVVFYFLENPSQFN